MAFQNYNIADNAYWKLEFDINSTQTTIHLSEQQNLPNNNFVMTIEQFSQDTVDKREKIFVSSRTSLELTVTRWFDWTSAKEFLAGDKVSLLIEQAVVNDIKTEVVRLESDKADKSNVVDLSSDQTIWGVKTFNSFPITPSSAPTTNYQVANKKYVDDNAGWWWVDVSEDWTTVTSWATDINFTWNITATDDWDWTSSVSVPDDLTVMWNYTTDDLSEWSNLYFTDERAQDAVWTIMTWSWATSVTYDDTWNTITISSTDTDTQADVSDSWSLVVSSATDINFWSNLSVSDDGDWTVTINWTSTTWVDAEDSWSIVVSGSTSFNFGSNLSVIDDGDWTVTIETPSTWVDGQVVSGAAWPSADIAVWNADWDLVGAWIAFPDIITHSSTNSFTNKTFDANGTGNDIQNLEVDDFTAAAIVTESDSISSNDNDTTLPTSAAVKDYVDNNAGWGWTISTLDILEYSWTVSTWVVSKYRAPQAWTLSEFKAYAETAPSGSDMTIDLEVNDTVVATATISDWTNKASDVTTFSNSTLSEDDKIEYNVTAVWSNTAGADLTLSLKLS